MAVDAFVGLGSNLGEPAVTVEAALDALATLPRSALTGRSRLYRSAPIAAGGPDYVNAVARLHTRLDPHELLRALLTIERDFGRERPWRNAPRTLDLDLLLHGDAVVADAALTIPHPRMHERAFVLRPLADLAPQATIPGRGAVAALLAAVAAQDCEPLPSPSSADRR